MKKMLWILLIVLLMILTSCRTTAPQVVLFSEFVAPPERPLMESITGEDVIERFKQLSANFIRAITTIERWEDYQDAQDYYYTEIIVR